jgi:hypothetical protein
MIFLNIEMRLNILQYQFCLARCILLIKVDIVVLIKCTDYFTLLILVFYKIRYF